MFFKECGQRVDANCIGRDGNNQIFPLAWPIVRVESRDTWSWFLNRPKEDLNVLDGLGYTIISDKQKVTKKYVCIIFIYVIVLTFVFLFIRSRLLL